MTLTEKALRVAAVAHKEQVRKTDGSPYVVHPIIVSLILKEQGFDEVVVAAAITHDVLEDTTTTREELVLALGEEVAVIVDGVSEDMTLEWEARKEAYVQVVSTGANSIKAVSIADKIHNAESIINDYLTVGATVWESFNRGKAKKIWFEELLYKEVHKTWDHPLLERYKIAIEKLKSLEE
jgi:(p)ppGpp synthase/HD superfamily hydrolase